MTFKRVVADRTAVVDESSRLIEWALITDMKQILRLKESVHPFTW